MALTFGTATSDRLTCGSGASIDTLDPFTYLTWVYPTTITSGRIHGFHKGTSPITRARFRLDNASGHMSVFVQRAGVDLSYIANNEPLVVNAWQFAAATFNSAAAVGSIAHIYRGTLSAAAVEVTYGTKTDGDGARNNDGANDLQIGNSNNTTLALQGRIAVVAYLAQEMTLPQIISWQWRPRSTATTKLFIILGSAAAASVQPDWTGNANNGTPTGLAMADHVPLGPWFGHQFGWPGAFTAAAPPAVTRHGLLSLGVGH